MKKNSIQLLLILLFFITNLMSYADESENPITRPPRSKEILHELALMPTQAGGRIKPMDTLARETMRILSGKEFWEGHEPVEIIFSILFNPKFWETYPFLQVNYKLLKDDLGLSAEKKYFSVAELRTNEKLIPLFQSLSNKEKAEEKLDPYFQAVSRIRNQIGYFSYIVSGQLFALVPPKKDATTTNWITLEHLDENLKMRFWIIAATFENKDPAVQNRAIESIRAFVSLAMDANYDVYPSRAQMERELHFNTFHPFRWAWILGAIAILVYFVSFVYSRKWVERAGFILFLSTILMEGYGFFLRMQIAGRPPVTNMYESVIWVAFGCLFFGLLIELVYRKKIIVFSALIFAVFCLLLADTSSTILDGSIHPLEPVLRSNFWLTIHVLTITLGYAAFALSMVLANLALLPLIFLGKESKLFRFKEMSLYTYRAVQVGVVLLGAGTILGGVWADYSWGRFWGWDPKETWALIAFLGYVAILHAKFRGIVRDFGFIATTVIAFLLVVMAWYGVNFVLGAGLHSYGFSSGGNKQMFVYLVVQCALVFAAVYMKKKIKV